MTVSVKDGRRATERILQKEKAVRALKKKKMLALKCGAPDSGRPDVLGHVTLPSVPSVWPVNTPLTPVQT